MATARPILAFTHLLQSLAVRYWPIGHAQSSAEVLPSFSSRVYFVSQSWQRNEPRSDLNMPRGQGTHLPPVLVIPPWYPATQTHSAIDAAPPPRGVCVDWAWQLNRYLATLQVLLVVAGRGGRTSSAISTDVAGHTLAIRDQCASEDAVGGVFRATAKEKKAV